MKNWYLVIVSLIGGFQGIYAADTELAQQAQVEIEIGPDDDDEYYYEDDDGPEIWIGPGLYYGIWFDTEDEYYRWYKDRYYHRYNHDYDHYHSEEEDHHKERHESKRDH